MAVSRREALAGALILPAACRSEPVQSAERPPYPVPVGAKGDGRTDDTAALQAAIDGLADKGGTLYLPPGIYRTVRPLIARSGVSLLGSGQHYEHTANRNRFTGSWIKADGDGLQIHSVQDCRFANFGIDCGEQPGSIAMSLGSDNNPACKAHLIENISIFGAGLGVRWGLSNKLAKLEQCDEISFRDIRMHSCVDGFRLDATNVSDFSRIERASFGELRGTAFDLRGPGFMTIADCAAGMIGNATMFRITGGSPDPVRIVGCQSEPSGRFLVAEGPNDQGVVILEGNVINMPIEARGVLRVVSRANFLNSTIALDGYVRWHSADDVWAGEPRGAPQVKGGAQFRASIMKDADRSVGRYLLAGTRIEGDDPMTIEVVTKAGIYRPGSAGNGNAEVRRVALMGR